MQAVITDTFEQGKGGVALVKMNQPVMKPQLFQHFRPANTQHDLLTQALFQVPGVEPGGNTPVPGIILLDIRIHEINGRGADADLPHGHMDGGIDQRHLEDQLAALVGDDPRNGGGLPVERLGDILLPSVLADLLQQISFGVHEPHPHHRNVQITALLNKIAGQKSQTAGIKGQRSMQSVFGRKVSHSHGFGFQGMRTIEKGVVPARHVVFKKGHNHMIVTQVVGIVRGRGKDVG